MKGQWSKLFVVTVAFLLLAGACVPAATPPPTPTPVPPTPTPAPSPLEIVQQYQDAIARHDVDTAMALFTDDAKYAWGEYFTTSDKTMIRNWHEYAAGLNSQTKANNCRPTGPTVTCEWRFVHDCFGAEGAIGAGYDMGGTVVFTVKDGKISEYVLTDSPDPEYSQWEEAFFKWLEDSYPMDIGSVVQALHTWKFDREFGERLVKFCKEQAESLKSAAVPAAGDPLSLTKAYQDAIARNDVDAAMAMFTDDAKYTWADKIFEDKAAIRNWLEYGVALNDQIKSSECKLTDPTVTCEWRFVNDCSGAGGPDEFDMASSMVFTAKEGKIGNISVSLNFGPEFTQWQQAFTAWATATYPAEIAAFNDAWSKGNLNREVGQSIVKLCKEYAESLKATPVAAAAAKAGKVELKKGEITSQALAGNLLGDATTRNYYVLLPPSYATSDKRYPVVYVLHNFGESVLGPVESIKQAYEDALQSGDAQEMIFVFPDAGNKLWGSLYLSSPTIGDYQTYLTKELVETIDTTYRTIADRSSRGVTGCGMGGNGSMGLALKYPKVYGVAVPASGLYDWEHDPFFDLALNSVLSLPSDLADLREGNWGAVWFLAAAAASAPNPNNPPFYANIPFTRVDGKAQIVTEVRNKMATADPVHDIQKYLAQPERLNALLLYHCTLDNNYGVSTEAARDFDRLLTTQGIEHEYLETNSGSMCTGYQSPAVKFMSDHLAGE